MATAIGAATGAGVAIAIMAIAAIMAHGIEAITRRATATAMAIRVTAITGTIAIMTR